jgi:hypothetical protein
MYIECIEYTDENDYLFIMLHRALVALIVAIGTSWIERRSRSLLLQTQTDVAPLPSLHSCWDARR